MTAFFRRLLCYTVPGLLHGFSKARSSTQHRVRTRLPIKHTRIAELCENENTFTSNDRTTNQNVNPLLTATVQIEFVQQKYKLHTKLQHSSSILNNAHLKMGVTASLGTCGLVYIHELVYGAT